jgi:hypothetical protein
MGNWTFISGTFSEMTEEAYQEAKRVFVDAPFTKNAYFFDDKRREIYLSSHGKHDNLDSEGGFFDQLAQVMKDAAPFFLDEELPAEEDGQYSRIYFKDGKWKYVHPQTTWPEDPFNERDVKDYAIMFINEEDIAARADDDTISAIKNFSEADIEDIAERLRDDIENSEYFMDIYWEYLKRTIENKIKEKE